MSVFNKIIMISLNTVTKNASRFNLTIRKLSDKFEDSCPTRPELLRIIEQKNQIQGALSSITAPLTTINNLANSLNIAADILGTTITIIKILPIPTSVPPGVGIPVSVITTFADSLDFLGDKLKELKGSTAIIPTVSTQINNSVGLIQNSISILDQQIQRCLTELSEETGESLFSILGDINFSLSSTSNNSDPQSSINVEQDLLDRLSPNSLNPIIYKGFTLTIENNPDNTFSFPGRRVKGFNNVTQQTIYNRPTNEYSFSSSTQVLINEIKFEIDKLLLGI